MPSLTIKNIPTDLYQQLKARAGQNRRSMNNEVIVCLERALKFAPQDEAALMRKIHTLRKQASSYLTEKERRIMLEEGSL